MRYGALIGAVFLAAVALHDAGRGATAQDYPNRPVRMVVAFPAGGTLDTLARIVSQKLGEEWGQPVVVENRPGAGGNIGAAAAARAAPDGYTLHFGAQSLAVNVTIAPVKLIDSAKARPGQLDYASLGPGTSAHLATVMFSDLVGIKMQQVSYSTLSQAVADLMAGRIFVYIPTLAGNLGNIQAGKVKALAVSGSARAAQLPDVPTFQEVGVPFVGETSWYGIYAPHGTPTSWKVGTSGS
jgi:tripartite-type tricarboxylate transporter receptor subunit TctC